MSTIELFENQGFGGDFIAPDNHTGKRWRIQIKTENGFIWHDLSDDELFKFALRQEFAAQHHLEKWQVDDMRKHFEGAEKRQRELEVPK